MMSRWSPFAISQPGYDGGLLLYTELFLSISSFIRRRSVKTMAVPVPSLSEYMPPYCFAHSVNL